MEQNSSVNPLIKSRIVLINGEINSAMAQTVITQLLYLDSVSNSDISLYINSPGGSVSDGMAIIDTMDLIRSSVSTVAVGMAASMGSLILAAGEKGKRFATPNSQIMIHAPLSSFGGSFPSIEANFKALEDLKDRINKLYADYTDRTIEEIETATKFDFYMFPEEAKDFGLIDGIVGK